MCALAVIVATTGCATQVRVPSDGRWYTVNAVHTNSQNYIVTLRKANVRDNETPASTSVRMRRLSEFQKYRELPDNVEDADRMYGDRGGIPLRLYDTGPMDLSLPGSRRVIEVSSGWELLIKSDGGESRVWIRNRKAASRTEQEETK